MTTRLGDEQGLVVAEGESLTVQPIGTPGLLLVTNLGFDAPGFDTGKRRPTSRPDLAVYQDGQQVADKIIRVNDPLTVGGYTFHQNGFGPAPDIVIRDEAGAALVRADPDDRPGGRASRSRSSPCRAATSALQLLLQRATDGTGSSCPAVPVARARTPTARPTSSGSSRSPWPAATPRRPSGTDFSLELRGFVDYTLLIAKRDPGQGIVWVAFASLIVGSS